MDLELNIIILDLKGNIGFDMKLVYDWSWIIKVSVKRWVWRGGVGRYVYGSYW